MVTLRHIDKVNSKVGLGTNFFFSYLLAMCFHKLYLTPFVYYNSVFTNENPVAQKSYSGQAAEEGSKLKAIPCDSGPLS